MRLRSLTAPDREDAPAACAKGSCVAAVALYIAVEFGSPERDAGLRLICEATAGVPVPEAAMNEDDSTVFRKNDVWPPRKIFGVEPKAIPLAMQ
jgi:hypothetical protein